MAAGASGFIGVLKDYRQRLLNVRVMLSLRRALFQRLLHLPLPKLWEMKTGGILSRLTGDVDTTTGLLANFSCPNPQPEEFIAGTEPTQTCLVDHYLEFDPDSDQAVQQPVGQQTESETATKKKKGFWDFLKVLKP